MLRYAQPATHFIQVSKKLSTRLVGLRSSIVSMVNSFKNKVNFNLE